LEWLHIVERIFDYKEVPEDKKVKLVALKLRKYASLWWTFMPKGLEIEMRKSELGRR